MLAFCALHILKMVLRTGGQSSCRMASHTMFMHMTRSVQHAHHNLVHGISTALAGFYGLGCIPAGKPAEI